MPLPFLTADRASEAAAEFALPFEDRDRWVELMRSSIASLAPRFSMARTVIEYAERYYVPTARAAR